MHRHTEKERTEDVSYWDRNIRVWKFFDIIIITITIIIISLLNILISLNVFIYIRQLVLVNDSSGFCCEKSECLDGNVNVFVINNYIPLGWSYASNFKSAQKTNDHQCLIVFQVRCNINSTNEWMREHGGWCLDRYSSAWGQRGNHCMFFLLGVWTCAPILWSLRQSGQEKHSLPK